MTETAQTRTVSTSPAQDLRVRRAAVVGASVAGALVTWAVASALTDIRVDNNGTITSVGAGASIAAGALAALAGWAGLAVLERLTTRALPVWTVAAAILLALSLGGPMRSGVDGGSKAALLAMHLVVGVVVIVGLRRSAPIRADRERA